MKERQLVEFVLQKVQPLGYGTDSMYASAFKWGDAAGTSDLVVFPRSGPLIAIVEVKKAVNDEANAMVVGQLLKYYARALRMGVDGVHALKEQLRNRASPLSRGLSPARLLECSESEANRQTSEGPRLQPAQIELHIVVDQAPPAMLRRLIRTCRALDEHHHLDIKLWKVNTTATRIEPIRESRIDDEGRAYAGSQRQIQLYVNRHTQHLNQAILEAVPDLRGAQAIEWVSPLINQQCQEYHDASALKALGLSSHSRTLAAFWPKGGPHWDALAKVTMRDGTPGVLLVEAKSHVAELDSPGSGAKDKSSVMAIRAALKETASWLGVQPPGDWMNTYYQAANRLAHLYFLREHVRTPAWLVNVYFENDHSPRRRTTHKEWVDKISAMKKELGLAGRELPYQSDIFLESLADPWAT